MIRYHALMALLAEIVERATAGKGQAQILCPNGAYLLVVASTKVDEVGESVLADDSISGHAFTRQQPIIIPDVQKSSWYREIADAAMRSEIALPLPKDAGVIHLKSPVLAAFEEQDTVVLQAYAERILEALPSTLALFEFNILLRIEQGIEERTTETYSQGVYESICALIGGRAQGLVGAERMQIMIVEDDNEYLRTVFSSHPLEKARVRVDDSVCGQAVTQRESINVADLSAPARYQKIAPGMRSELVVVAREGNRVSVVINAESSRVGAFTDRDETLLKLFAQQAGRALKHLRFAQTVERLQDEKNAAQQTVGAAYVLSGMLHDFTNSAEGIRYWLRQIGGESNENVTVLQAISAIERGLDSLREIPRQFQQTLVAAEHLVALDLNQVVMQTVNRLRQGKLVLLPNIETEIDCNGTIIVYTSAYYLEKVIQNLISNAVEAVGTNGCIRIHSAIKSESVSESDSHAELIVADTGRGMDEETLRRVLHSATAFHAGEGTPSPKMGFGLSWIKYYISRFGGDLHISSQLGKGTTVLLSMPLAKPRQTISIRDAST
jgi:putative methionine-R-sulfoxide reductase with GAF domain